MMIWSGCPNRDRNSDPGERTMLEEVVPHHHDHHSVQIVKNLNDLMSLLWDSSVFMSQKLN